MSTSSRHRLSSRSIRGWLALVGLATAAFGACSTSDSSAPASIVVVTTTTRPAVTTTVAIAGIESTASTVDAAPPTTRQSAPLATLDVAVELAADGFRQPILATSRPGDQHLFIADQSGVVYALDLDSGATEVVLDIADRVRFSGEQGLLGIAFDPADPDLLVVHYSAMSGATTVVTYRLDGVGAADLSSLQVILELEQPARNHNGGMVAFGPDGYLYVALGDGGGANDQFDNGQDPFTLLGAILRIDLNGADRYSIPPDNPFADGSAGAPEVWAWGLRNPWRMAFDGSDLWVGDVGQGTWEEVDRLPPEPGLNGGWPIVEGTHCFRSDACDQSPFLDPVFEYRHTDGRCSITGGVVYRGTQIPDLVGAYLFGDYCTGEIWALRPEDPGAAVLLTDPVDGFLPALPGLTSFGIGPDAEVYVLQSAGVIWRLVASSQ